MRVSVVFHSGAKITKRQFRISIASLVALFLLVGANPIQAGPVVPGGSTVAGETIGQWTADWWNWVGWQPDATNPCST